MKRASRRILPPVILDHVLVTRMANGSIMRNDFPPFQGNSGDNSLESTCQRRTRTWGFVVPGPRVRVRQVAVFGTQQHTSLE